MQTNKKIDPPTPEKQHKDQVTIQIVLPIAIIVILCLTGFIFLLVSSSSQSTSLEQWSQISTAFILLPILLLSLIPLILTILLIKLSANLNGTLPDQLRKIRFRILDINTIVQQKLYQPARPFIFFKSSLSGFKAIFNKKSSTK